MRRAPSRTCRELIQGYLGDGNKMGEGWLLTAEMLELIHTGTGNIVCTQPFGCLPNHIVGKGMIRKLKDDYPTAISWLSTTIPAPPRSTRKTASS
ncbi:MAG: hypothetical protein ACLRWQ_19565 [Flavonifractor plautii]